MPKNCPNCSRALEELLQEVQKMAAKNHLGSNVAAKVEVTLQAAIAEAKKDKQDLKVILSKLNMAKGFIAGVESASSLQNNFVETITLVRSHLP